MTWRNCNGLNKIVVQPVAEFIFDERDKAGSNVEDRDRGNDQLRNVTAGDINLMFNNYTSRLLLLGV